MTGLILSVIFVTLLVVDLAIYTIASACGAKLGYKYYLPLIGGWMRLIDYLRQK